MTTKSGSHKTSQGKTEDGKKTVRYHDTDVVTWDDNVIILDTGGWKTKTTRLRMNQVSEVYNLGYRVWQKDWVWYVDYKGETLEWLPKGHTDLTYILRRERQWCPSGSVRTLVDYNKETNDET